MKHIIKIIWKAINILSIAVFLILLIYFFFKQHEGVDARAFDCSLLFFAGMSCSSLISFAKSIFNYSKNTELVTQIKNSVGDIKAKKELKKVNHEKAIEDIKKMDTPTDEAKQEPVL